MAEQQFVVFSLATEQYGVPVDQVQSIERMLPITPVPKTLSFVRGVVNLRGVVTPVIDLRDRFGFPATDFTDDTRVIVVKVETTTVGLIVDGVNDVQYVDTDTVEQPPAVVGGVQAVYLNGIARIGDDLLVLLNLTKVLSDAEALQLQEVEKSAQE